VTQTLILHWNGHGWKRMPSPNPAGSAHGNSLLAVAADSASSAWAVGLQFKNGVWQSLIERWNGTSWKNVRAPGPGPSTPSQLNSVTAISARDAWAVGSYGNSGARHTLIEHWNGKAWHRMPSPSPGVEASLFGAASSGTSVWSVGSFTSGGPVQTLAVHCC